MSLSAPSINSYVAQTANNSKPAATLQNNVQTKIPEQKPDEVNLKKKETIKKVAVGAGIIATIASVIYLAKSGKGAKIVDAIKGKKVSLEDVKFDKGKAVLKGNGKDFTGKINHTLEDGSNVVMQYKKGVLQKSTKTNDVNDKIFEKIYQRAENGDLIVSNNGHSRNITESKKFIQNALKDKDALNIKLKNGKFDYSKEVEGFFLQDNTTYRGFEDKNINYNGKEWPGNFGSADYAKNADGKLKIKYTMRSCWADYIKKGDEGTPLAAGINAVSKDGKLTDAQKVIVAANVQGLDFSPNSPIGKVSFDSKTREEVLDILAKWSKDINKNDPKTIATIKAIEAMPNNKYHWSNILEHIGKE